MSLVKSFSVGNGDMYYIRHNSDNLTVIDCCLYEDRRAEIMTEIIGQARPSDMFRFISTHPDEDHLRGLEYFNTYRAIWNFYCVKNNCTKEDETDDFLKYRELHDSSVAYYIYKGCSRKWMNIGDNERGSAGISIHWPDISNAHFLDALADAEAGYSPNNISPIIEYGVENSGRYVWMGDLETDFMDVIQYEVDLPDIDVLFAPHHGRDSGKIPASFLQRMTPSLIVIGEAPSQHLNYYVGYNTITQNTAGDITFESVPGYIDIYVESGTYRAPFLLNRRLPNSYGGYYLGSLSVAT